MINTGSMLTDVCSFLHTLTGVGTIGTSLFRGAMPSSPAQCVAVLPTGGLRDVVRDNNAVKRTQFQVLIRDPIFNTGLQKTERIFDAMNDKFNILSASNPGRIMPDHEPGVVFKDENANWLFSLNFTVTLIRKAS